MNARQLPTFVEGYGPVRPFTGIVPPPARVTRAATRVCPFRGSEKLLHDIDSAFDACDIRSGAMLSFHHHLRNGDQVLNAVLSVAARRRLTDLGIAASSLFPVHAPLVEHMRHGVVTRISTAYAAGQLLKHCRAVCFPRPC